MSYAYLFKYIIIGDTGKYLFLLPYLDTTKNDKKQVFKHYREKILSNEVANGE